MDKKTIQIWGGVVLGEDEFLRLLKKEEGRLYRIAVAILANEQDAWDSLQQTAEQAWKKRTDLKGGAVAFPSWIKQIVVRQSLNLLRSRKRQVPTDPQEMKKVLDLAAGNEQSDIGLIWGLVLELGTEHRQVIVLRYLGDLSLADIAGELDIPLGTVKSRLNTAHTRLREKLPKRG